MKNIGWSVYEKKENNWARVFTGKSFQHACNIYDQFREKSPEKAYTINYSHGEFEKQSGEPKS